MRLITVLEMCMFLRRYTCAMICTEESRILTLTDVCKTGGVILTPKILTETLRQN